VHACAAGAPESDGTPIDSFRANPHRRLDPALELIASYVSGDDVLIDVEEAPVVSLSRSHCAAGR
jgi:hypothetical protein